MLVAFSVLLGNAVYVDLMGIAVGHAYYFLEDVFPNVMGGFKILKTPQFLWVSLKKNCGWNTNEFQLRKALLDELPENVDYQRLPEDNPGGFDWGNQQEGDDNNRRNENQQNAENNQWFLLHSDNEDDYYLFFSCIINKYF